MKSLKSKFNQLLTIMVFALGLLSSCGNYEEFKEDSSALFEGTAGAGTLTFKEVSEQVIGTKCLKCHGDYDQYAVVLGNIEAIAAAVRSDRMPADGPLSNTEKGILFSWIAAGAPAGDVVVEPIRPDPTFVSLQKTIFAAKCIRCHTEGGPAPFYLNDRTNLMVYASVFNPFLFDFEFPEEGDFIKRLRSDSPVEQMPPARSGLELLTEEEIEVVTEWIRRGLP